MALNCKLKLLEKHFYKSSFNFHLGHIQILNSASSCKSMDTWYNRYIF